MAFPETNSLPGDDSAVKILIFEEILNQHYAKEKISIKTTISELEKCLGNQQIPELDIKKRIKAAPDPDIAIEIYLGFYEKNLLNQMIKITDYIIPSGSVPTWILLMDMTVI